MVHIFFFASSSKKPNPEDAHAWQVLTTLSGGNAICRRFQTNVCGSGGSLVTTFAMQEEAAHLYQPHVADAPPAKMLRVNEPRRDGRGQMIGNETLIINIPCIKKRALCYSGSLIVIIIKALVCRPGVWHRWERSIQTRSVEVYAISLGISWLGPSCHPWNPDFIAAHAQLHAPESHLLWGMRIATTRLQGSPSHRTY
jgi:hypothetical protein